MKRILMILIAVLFLMGCSVVIEQAQKTDASLAAYLGKEKLTLNCKAGIAQADLDMSESAPVMKIKAVTKYADPASQDYMDCYGGAAWLYYTAAKAEGAVKAMVKKAAEIGIAQ
jgi:uncharacterized protein YceK